MNESKWFWAWKWLKKRERQEPPQDEILTDYAFMSALLDAMRGKAAIEGDGKFSRVENYVKGLRTELEWCRSNWVGSDDVFTAFFMGVDAMCTELEHNVEKIKKGH
jgi:hypothetical protein